MVVLFALKIQDIADARAKFGCGNANVGQILLGFDIPNQRALGGQNLVFQGETVELKVLFCERWMEEVSPLDGSSASQSQCNHTVRHITCPCDTSP